MRSPLVSRITNGMAVCLVQFATEPHVKITTKGIKLKERFIWHINLLKTLIISPHILTISLKPPFKGQSLVRYQGYQVIQGLLNRQQPNQSLTRADFQIKKD